MHQSIADIESKLEHHDLNFSTVLHRINCNVSHLVASLGCWLFCSQNGDKNVRAKVTLVWLKKNLRSPHHLWMELEFGLDGNNSARDFVWVKGGGDKHKVYLRIFGDKFAKLFAVEWQFRLRRLVMRYILCIMRSSISKFKGRWQLIKMWGFQHWGLYLFSWY